jgi:hypothetical protein
MRLATSHSADPTARLRARFARSSATVHHSLSGPIAPLLTDYWPDKGNPSFVSKFGPNVRELRKRWGGERERTVKGDFDGEKKQRLRSFDFQGREYPGLNCNLNPADRLTAIRRALGNHKLRNWPIQNTRLRNLFSLFWTLWRLCGPEGDSALDRLSRLDEGSRTPSIGRPIVLRAAQLPKETGAFFGPRSRDK